MGFHKKKQKNVKDGEEDVGDLYSHTSISVPTRLLIGHVEGPRDSDTAELLFTDIERKRDANTPLPVFTSDNWDPFAEGLLRVHGVIVQPEYQGIGRPPKPQIVPRPDLKYAQVVKKRKKDQIVESVKRVVYGDEKEVWGDLGVKEDGVLSTSYVERLNLTIRNSLARFVRKGMNFSKNKNVHTRVVDFFQAWYNFCKPHDSLKLPFNDTKRKWTKRTPAMAEGITDHVWSFRELLTFRVPIQP